MTHCITRLRFKLKDESIAKTDIVKKIKGVVSVVQAGGRIPGISLEGAPDIKEVGIAAFISGIFGTISEPAIYGVNLKYKRPFICASIFTGIGGAIIAAAGADCIMQLGSISIYTMAMFVTQLKPFPPLEADKPATTGLVFDTFDGDISPELNSWQNDESTLKYGWFTPKHEAGQKLPLIIWLHGAGEGGNDPLVAYTGNRVTALSSPKVQRELGGAAWVLVPQCPTGEYKDEHGRPKRYMNHGVWVLMLDDVCRADVDGRAVLCDGVPCTIWEWMGKQHL